MGAVDDRSTAPLEPGVRVGENPEGDIAAVEHRELGWLTPEERAWLAAEERRAAAAQRSHRVGRRPATLPRAGGVSVCGVDPDEEAEMDAFLAGLEDLQLPASPPP